MEGEKEKREGGRREKKRREEEGEGKKACQLSPLCPSLPYMS
jgi:hypothetical protein